MGVESYRPVPIYWNTVDGRLETFYKAYQVDMSSSVQISISSFKVVDYIRKSDNSEIGYMSGGKHGDFIRDVKENVVYDLSKHEPKLAEIWELVGFITPFSYENITINEPMRRIINIGEFYEILSERTSKAKFNYFKKLSNSNNEKNVSKQICNFPDDIIGIIGKYCGVDD
jgi:hypothetical protein